MTPIAADKHTADVAAHLAAMSLAADEQAERMVMLDPDRSYYRGLAVAYRTAHDLLVGVQS